MWPPLLREHLIHVTTFQTLISLAFNINSSFSWETPCLTWPFWPGKRSGHITQVPPYTCPVFMIRGSTRQELRKLMPPTLWYFVSLSKKSLRNGLFSFAVMRRVSVNKKECKRILVTCFTHNFFLAIKRNKSETDLIHMAEDGQHRAYDEENLTCSCSPCSGEVVFHQWGTERRKWLCYGDLDKSSFRAQATQLNWQVV